MDNTLGLWDTSKSYVVYLWPCVVQGKFVVIRRTGLNMAKPCSSKTTGRRTRRTKIWDSGNLVIHMCCIWHCRVQCHLGPCSAIASTLPVTLKWLSVEWNWVKFRTQGHWLWLILEHHNSVFVRRTNVSTDHETTNSNKIEFKPIESVRVDKWCTVKPGFKVTWEIKDNMGTKNIPLSP